MGEPPLHCKLRCNFRPSVHSFPWVFCGDVGFRSGAQWSRGNRRRWQMDRQGNEAHDNTRRAYERAQNLREEEFRRGARERGPLRRPELSDFILEDKIGSNGDCRGDLSLAHPPNPVFER